MGFTPQSPAFSSLSFGSKIQRGRRSARHLDRIISSAYTRTIHLIVTIINLKLSSSSSVKVESSSNSARKKRCSSIRESLSAYSDDQEEIGGMRWADRVRLAVSSNRANDDEKSWRGGGSCLFTNVRQDRDKLERDGPAVNCDHIAITSINPC
jgi:hypothetical protein